MALSWCAFLLAACWAAAPAYGAEIRFVDEDPNPGRLLGSISLSGFAPNLEHRVFWARATWSRVPGSPSIVISPFGDPIAVTTPMPSSTDLAIHLTGPCFVPEPTSTPSLTSSTISASQDDCDDVNCSTVENMTSTTESPPTTTARFSTTPGIDIAGMSADNATDTTLSPTTVGPTTTTEAPCGAPAPAAATHLLVRTYAAEGDANGGLSRRLDEYTEQWAKISDWSSAAPSSVVLQVAFRDENPVSYMVQGSVQIQPETPEPTNIDGYRVYFEGMDGNVDRLFQGGRNPWIGEVTATGFQVEAPLDGETFGIALPEGVQRFVVVAYNRDGEAATGFAGYFYDVGGFAQGDDFMWAIVAGVSGALVGISLIFLYLVVRRLVVVENKAHGEDAEQGSPQAEAKKEVVINIRFFKQDIRIPIPKMPTFDMASFLGLLRNAEEQPAIGKRKFKRPRVVTAPPFKLLCEGDVFELWLPGSGLFSDARVIYRHDVNIAECQAREASAEMRQAEHLNMRLIHTGGELMHISKASLRWPPRINQRVQVAARMTSYKALAKKVRDAYCGQDLEEKRVQRASADFTWVSGRIEGIPSPNKYTVRLSDNFSDTIAVVDAHHLRPIYDVGDEVFVPITVDGNMSGDRLWCIGIVEDAGPMEPSGPLEFREKDEVFSFQELVVRLDPAGEAQVPEEVVTVSSREVQIPDPDPAVLAMFYEQRDRRCASARAAEDRKFVEALLDDGPRAPPVLPCARLPLGELTRLLGYLEESDFEGRLTKGLPCLVAQCKFKGSAVGAKFCSQCGATLRTLQDAYEEILGAPPLSHVLIMPFTKALVQVPLGALMKVKEKPFFVKGANGMDAVTCSYEADPSPRLILDCVVGPGPGASKITIAGGPEGPLELVGHDSTAYGLVHAHEENWGMLEVEESPFLSFRVQDAQSLRVTVVSERGDQQLELGHGRQSLLTNRAAAQASALSWEFCVVEGGDWMTVLATFLGMIVLGFPALPDLTARIDALLLQEVAREPTEESTPPVALLALEDEQGIRTI